MQSPIYLTLTRVFIAPARAWLTKPYSKENLSSMKPTTSEKLAHTGRIRFTSSCRDTSSDSSMVKGGSVVCARDGFKRAYLPSVPCGVNVKHYHRKLFLVFIVRNLNYLLYFYQPRQNVTMGFMNIILIDLKSHGDIGIKIILI